MAGVKQKSIANLELLETADKLHSAAVSGFLSGCAVIGAIVYPPLMGFISVEAGLTVAMVGAAILSFACALVLFTLGRRESVALEGATEPA
jgi:fucose permease